MFASYHSNDLAGTYGYCGIILDLDMPIMGGLEACERIINAYSEFHQLSLGQFVPIISQNVKLRMISSNASVHMLKSNQNIINMGQQEINEIGKQAKR